MLAAYPVITTIPILLGNQIRMVLRVAAIYGEPLSARHFRELVPTVIGGLLFRYLAEETAKIVPFGGDLVAGAIAAAGTWSLGMVAIEYFESGKRLSGDQLRDMFDRFYQKYRAQNPAPTTKTQQPVSPLPPNAIVIDQDPPSASTR